ncbi:MAG: tripartite tricarboxylate transporter substrate binding protein [Deltaproteobacteria bacterium]|nr:tripartite tricarboxylate transporter substrate binding protein [Deltaproteobacteria bacterium]
MRKHISWCFALAAIVAIAVLLPITPVMAADYPTKPLNYMVCFNPGGETDITARIQEPVLKKYYKEGVVISYKIGGGGSVGWAELVKAKPDGYTLAGDNLPHIILQPMLRGNAGYQTLDIKQVYIFESTPNILVVRSDSPYKTLKDFIAAAKAKPGTLTLGGSGSSTANDLGSVMLNKAAGIKTVYIPFTGSGPVVPALLGGHVTGLMTYSTMAVQQREKFRPLAIMSEERMAVLPDVPTFKELGFDLVEGAYRGVAAPPGTPDDIVEKAAAIYEKVMQDPDVIKKMDENGFKIERMGPKASTELVKKRMVLYREMMLEMGLLKK